MRASDGVDELIGEARSAARAAVAARLEQRFEAELLEAVERRLSAPAEAGDGLWLYCVAGAEHPDVEAEGIPAAGPPRLVRAGGLSALVSAVPLSEFGEQALERNLNDLEWLESMARAHEAVLDAALAGGAIVPMRVCTIYRDEQRVRSLLEAERESFAQALDVVRGSAEWGVKVIAPPAQASVPEQPPDPAAYLDRKRRQRLLRERSHELAAQTAQACHERLSEASRASRSLAPQQPELGGYEGEMILNGAYLVDDDRAPAFRDLVERMSDELAGDGIAIDLTGPWPAYNFTAQTAA